MICWHCWQTPGHLDQQKMNATVTEVSRSASKVAALKAQKEPAPDVKRRFALLLGMLFQGTEMKVSMFSSSCLVQPVLY